MVTLHSLLLIASILLFLLAAPIIALPHYMDRLTLVALGLALFSVSWLV